VSSQSLSWSTDGKSLPAAVLSLWWWSGIGELTDLLQRSGVATLQARSGMFAWSPNGTYLALASEDQTAIVWSAASGIPLQVFKTWDTAPPVLSVSWSHDSTRLAVGGQGVIWNVTTGKQLYAHTIRDHGNWAWGTRWKPNCFQLRTEHCPDLGCCHWQPAGGHQGTVEGALHGRPIARMSLLAAMIQPCRSGNRGRWAESLCEGRLQEYSIPAYSLTAGFC